MDFPSPARQTARSLAHVVGFLDSGIGGLTVWREAMRLLPDLSTRYLADNLHCPYGSRPPEDVRDIVLGATHRLLDEGCTALVLACNTATAAAVSTLRRLHPNIPIVGMEPAVKPAALQSKTGVVGILATSGTLHGRLFRDTSARYASNVRLVIRDAGNLVPFVERFDVASDALRRALTDHLAPMLQAGADHIVLGCTHFPYLLGTIREIVGPDVRLIDPAPAVARQLARRLGALAPEAPALRAFSATGAPVDFEKAIALLDRASPANP